MFADAHIWSLGYLWQNQNRKIKGNELKLICNCKETTYEATLIERHCMLSINKKANKQIWNKWEKKNSLLGIDMLMQYQSF